MLLYTKRNNPLQHTHKLTPTTMKMPLYTILFTILFMMREVPAYKVLELTTEGGQHDEGLVLTETTRVPLTSLNQIKINGDIDTIQISDIEKMFKDYDFVAFYTFRVQRLRAVSTSSTTGARGILTTSCDYKEGQSGAVYCDYGVEKCVSFEFLQQYPYTENGKSRFGFCFDFLPLDEDLKAEIAAQHQAFALALWQTCDGKDKNCL